MRFECCCVQDEYLIRNKVTEHKMDKNNIGGKIYLNLSSILHVKYSSL